MNILFIGTQRFDYSQDLTFSGLCKMQSNVKIFLNPFLYKYFEPWKRYPKNIGNNNWRNIVLLSSVKKADLVIVASLKPDCLHAYASIIEKIPASVPVVLIDGGDRPEIAGDTDRYNIRHIYSQLVSYKQFSMIFKREMLIDRVYPENVKPFPFSVNMDIYKNIKFKSFKYDVSFWAVESHPIRTKVLEMLESRYDCAANGTSRNQVFSKYKRKGVYYLKELKSCRIILNFRGGGWDTLRYWEVFGLGRFMISQKPGICIPNPFVSKEHVVYCADDASDLFQLCDEYLKNDKTREQIAKNGLLHAMQFHTDEARARYLLDNSGFDVKSLK